MKSLPGAARSMIFGRVIRRGLMMSLVMVLAMQAARAEATPDDEEAAGEIEEAYWYGPSVMGADGVGLAVVLLGAERNSYETMAFGALALGVSGPIVHLAHGRNLEAGLSLGMRVGLPLLLLAVVSPKSCEGASFPCNTERQVAFAGLSLVGAMILDWAYLSRGSRTVKPASTDQASWLLAPTLAVSEKGARVGVLGRF